LQILKNDLRRAALEKQAVELKHASPEQRRELIAKIEEDVAKQIRGRVRRSWFGRVCY
jgi:transposase